MLSKPISEYPPHQKFLCRNVKIVQTTDTPKLFSDGLPRSDYGKAAQRQDDIVCAIPDAPLPSLEIEYLDLRMLAAIELKVPLSGVDWLDEMIILSRKLTP